MKPTIYEHFHPEEKPFIDRAEEWIERSAQLHELRRTDFLDPRQGEIVAMLANRNGDVTVRLEGGHPGAERKRAIIAPDYRHLEDEPMGIAVLEVTAPGTSFAALDHGDFLGSILGLGVKRDVIGDIHPHDSFCHILVTEEMADYVLIHLRQVHRIHVLSELLPLEKLKPAVQKLEETSLSVASMRLDGIASDVFRISRSKVVDPIRAGRCRVNWRTEENPSTLLNEGDVVSMKGLGRFKVLQVDGMTKKGRIRVAIGKFI
ncbi:YlmH/Sll1252 family protein [Paenibacillus sp. J5C_2022]|uniref:YlmH family RNA-binding protein n=1 Tax=Paenibacillus sp. J5C2022 TaxID=2977129 RepID=UPI0021CE699A|nr:YlmH/Sll1252 family protein [Paenibacillus sp. J5C2022]MCU6709454.1 YlmH/Sll1252 family protein [Paenibacillus sp. J5C2022]